MILLFRLEFSFPGGVCQYANKGTIPDRRKRPDPGLPPGAPRRETGLARLLMSAIRLITWSSLDFLLGRTARQESGDLIRLTSLSHHVRTNVPDK
jgi:hypothetical protein